MAPADSGQLQGEGLQALPHFLLLAGHHLEVVLVEQLEGGGFFGGGVGQEGQHFLHALFGERVQVVHFFPHLLGSSCLLGQGYLEGGSLRP